jgi:hypothetical protein
VQRLLLSVELRGTIWKPRRSCRGPNHFPWSLVREHQTIMAGMRGILINLGDESMPLGEQNLEQM